MSADEFDEAYILQELKNVHFTSGVQHNRLQRYKALKTLLENELESIFYLVDAHVPTLRTKTAVRYEKISCNNSNSQLTQMREYMGVKCTNADVTEGVKELLRQLEEMPKEWTLVQLTPMFNPQEEFNNDNNKRFSDPLHITVFTCGKNEPDPFSVVVDCPKSNNKTVELAQEMHSIIVGNKTALLSSSNKGHFKSRAEKSGYVSRRQAIENRLKCVITDIQNMWLKEWRCLLIGKYVDDSIEAKIKAEIKKFVEDENLNVTDRQKTLMYYLVKGNQYLSLLEVKRGVVYCFPDVDKNVHKKIASFIRKLSTNVSVKKHPVILIMDDSLDFLPWEMMDVLVDESVSRVPSLHFVYSLFKEHQQDIRNGHKIVQHYDKGAYIVNPSTDLKSMEIRMMSFFNYWTPEWTGIAGYQPSFEEFYELLTSSDIFSYNGHGSGAQFLSCDKIQKTHVKAVVLLFGCCSVQLNKTGPQIELHGNSQMYYIARCPLVVGMLWEVTDADTDVLTTEFLSQWVPSKANVHWRNIDKTKWRKAEKFECEVVESLVGQEGNCPHEPELLRALSAAKKLSSYLGTKAACVARGIPVKIATAT